MRVVTKYILSNFGGKAATREEIEKACKRFRADAQSTINFMISYGYFLRILRGLYYIKTVEEFKLKKSVNVYEILSLGMDKLGINWHFGLYTGLRLNGLTHEFFYTIFILNDRIFRAREIKVGGQKVKFLKLKGKLFGFGIVDKNHIKFSDVEKTILDLVYVSKYRSTPRERIISMIEEYGKKVRTEKIKAYIKSYPKTVEEVVKSAGLV